MKKILSIALALALICSLGACGGKNSTPSTPSDTPPSDSGGNHSASGSG